MAHVDLTVKRGNTIVLDLVITNPDGSDRDITGAKVWFTVKRFKSEPDADALIRKGNAHSSLTGITLTAPATGGVQIVTEPSETDELPDDFRAWYDVQILETSGRVSTPFEGYLTVAADITRAVVAS